MVHHRQHPRFVVLNILCGIVAATAALSSSIGQAVQSAQTEAELLSVAKTLWLPTDEALAPHLRHQKIHHEKRQRWSAQLLDKLPNLSDWGSPAFTRAVRAASVPFGDDDVAVEGTSIFLALQGIHRLLGRPRSTSTDSCCTALSTDAMGGIMQLIQRAEALGDDFELHDAVSVRWACRGILRRLMNTTSNHSDTMAFAVPKLDARVRRLPFDIHPLGVANVFENDSNINTSKQLQDAIPFQTDRIVTRTGEAVLERRATAWLAEEGIGALAYSGKLMPPKHLPPLVQKIMRNVERELGTASPYFDCALCNYYPDSEVACKFHTDPEHGTFWERLTCVVSVGDDRRFAFRPIGTWEGYSHDRPAVIDLFPGDIVRMDDHCNDEFLHAVYPARDNSNNDAQQGRISLVLKRAIARAGGKRGHGLQGQGRRSKRR